MRVIFMTRMTRTPGSQKVALSDLRSDKRPRFHPCVNWFWIAHHQNDGKSEFFLKSKKRNNIMNISTHNFSKNLRKFTMIGNSKYEISVENPPKIMKMPMKSHPQDGMANYLPEPSPDQIWRSTEQYVSWAVHALLYPPNRSAYSRCGW